MYKFLFIFFILSIAFFTKSNSQFYESYQTVFADSTLKTIYQKVDAILLEHPMLVVKNSSSEVVVEKPRNASDNTGLFFGVLALLYLFAIIKNIFLKHFTNLYNVFTTFNISKRQMKEQLENNVFASSLFLFLFLLCTSCILYFIVKNNALLQPIHSEVFKYGICLSVVVLFFLVKRSLSKLVAFTFDKLNWYNEYQFTNKMVNEFTGLMLFPISIFLLLLKGKLFSVFLTIGVVLFVAMAIFKYIRLMNVSKKLANINFIHFLLYLCTFEIVPILILIHLIRN